MAEPKFKVGDVVYLNSDKSINLTINEIRTEPNESTVTKFKKMYQCIWFDKAGILQSRDFKEETLTSAALTK